MSEPIPPSDAAGPDDDRTRRDRRARGFGSVADAYDRGRPSYPEPAVDWLVGEQPTTVLELGAGTGKLTEQLVARGHTVHAVDPDEEMLRRLSLKLPEVDASVGSAEEIPLPDDSVDVVVAAQAFHWFDLARALPEIQRVLRPSGRLSLVWNSRNERIPWVKRLGRLIGSDQRDTGPSETLDDDLTDSLKFIMLEREEFTHWQQIDRSSIIDLAASRSAVISLPEEERAAKLTEVLAFYDDFGRGMDGMQLPYRTECLRLRVVKARTPAPAAVPPPRPVPGATAASTTVHDSDATQEFRIGTPAEPPNDDDDGVLLIDFR